MFQVPTFSEACCTSSSSSSFLLSFFIFFWQSTISAITCLFTSIRIYKKKKIKVCWPPFWDEFVHCFYFNGTFKLCCLNLWSLAYRLNKLWSPCPNESVTMATTDAFICVILNGYLEVYTMSVRLIHTALLGRNLLLRKVNKKKYVRYFDLIWFLDSLPRQQQRQQQQYHQQQQQPQHQDDWNYMGPY